MAIVVRLRLVMPVFMLLQLSPASVERATPPPYVPAKMVRSLPKAGDIASARISGFAGPLAAGAQFAPASIDLKMPAAVPANRVRSVAKAGDMASARMLREVRPVLLL